MIAVYLAGGITHHENPKLWRRMAKLRLVEPFVAVDPMDTEVDYTKPQEIVQGDLQLIDECRAILLDASIASWGTAMEIFYATQRGIPVFGWGAPATGRVSPWLIYHCQTLSNDLDLAIKNMREHFGQ